MSSANTKNKKPQILFTAGNISETVDDTIDTAKLLTYLQCHVPGEFKSQKPVVNDNNTGHECATTTTTTTLELYRFSSGFLNPPFLMKYGEQRYVLRRDASLPVTDPTHWGLKTTTTLRKTYELMDLIHKDAQSQIPVPRMLIFCADLSIIGEEFYVMEFIDGRIFLNTASTDAHTVDGAQPMHDKDKRELQTELARVLALIHSFTLSPALLHIFDRHNSEKAAFTPAVVFRTMQPMFEAMTLEKHQNERNPLVTTANVGRFHEKMLPRIRHKLSVEQECHPEFSATDDRNLMLVHGDCHWENIIWHPTENRIIAVVDWEMAHLGRGCYDLYWNTIIWAVFAFLDIHHGRGIHDLVKGQNIHVVRNEFNKHFSDRLFMRNAYARALQEINPMMYGVYESELADDENGAFYEALVMWRFVGSMAHDQLVNDDESEEDSEHLKELKSAFPIMQMCEFVSQIGLCLLNEEVAQPAAMMDSLQVIDGLLNTLLL